MVDFSSLPPIAQRIVLEVDLEFVLSIQRMTLEELVAFAESEHDLDEDNIQVIRDTIVDKLEHRIPQVFGVNAMKKYYSEAETAEERQAHAERLVVNAQAELERRERRA